MSAWTWLLLAGAVEVIWSQSIKPTEGFTRPLPTLLCLALGATSVYLLSRAMQGVPVGTSYVVFTGIGGIGAVTLGVLLSGDTVSPQRLAGVTLIVAGVIVCHLSQAHP